MYDTLRLFISFRTSFEICESVVVEINNTLGEDKQHCELYKIMSMTCKPLTLKSSQQSLLLVICVYLLKLRINMEL